MLAIARALMTGPELLLLDEPSQGLAPLVVSAVMDTIRELKSQRVSMLLVEQNAEMALQLADRVYVIDHGTVVFEGAPAAAARRPAGHDDLSGRRRLTHSQRRLKVLYIPKQQLVAFTQPTNDLPYAIDVDTSLA